MFAESVYIVQSQIIELGKIPFDISKSSLRDAFRPVFVNTDCFTRMRTLILNNDRPIPLPSQPFIRGLGQVCFNTRSARLSNTGERSYYLPRYLSNTDEYWDDRARSNYECEEDIRFFGYDRSLEDQRMNFLYFELRNPLFLKAFCYDQVQADGKIFIHLYPSGYVVLHLAVSLKRSESVLVSEIRDLIRETRPNAANTKWKWWTRLTTGNLSEIVDVIKDNLLQSIFIECPVIKSSSWKSAIKIVSANQSERLVTAFVKGDHDILKITRDSLYPPAGEQYLISSRQGIICNFSPHRKRRSSLRMFWKIFTLYEFVMLKNHIYQSYTDLLESEILRLQEYRLRPLHKLAKEDIRRFSVFDPLIPKYLFALDRHIKSASPFHRRIYSAISKGFGFDERREKVKKLVKEWEAEVEKWEHSVIVLWKKVASPLLSLLGLH